MIGKKTALILLSGLLLGSAGLLQAPAEPASELPFTVRPFRTGPEWKGKTVLVEFFTGSECPPCAGADLGLDALLETFESKALTVLAYHVPIPRPDPMQNHASLRRAAAYAIDSAPSVYFDGAAGPRGGGPAVYGERLYEVYKKEVLRRLNAAPGVKLGLSAALKGDNVVVSYTLDKIPPDAEFHFALVQEEEKYSGYNGIDRHHRVVKELITLEAAPKPSGRLTINLTAAEAAAVKHVADFERLRRIAFPAKLTAIGRRGLRVVFFVQDRISGSILNASTAEVK
ncbi:MAG: hypothetical protein JW747_01220 [Candidatus Aminicenantes bacterium]|nr:hypothetical protein [Candidatus Aminicenantes bacterium]